MMVDQNVRESFLWEVRGWIGNLEFKLEQQRQKNWEESEWEGVLSHDKQQKHVCLRVPK